MGHGGAPVGDLAAGGVEDPAADGGDVAGFFGEGDEVPGLEQAECWVLPADEGFHAEDLTRAQVGDGLVVEAQLACGDGEREVGFQGGPVDHAVVDVGVVELGAVFAAAFGHIHREVGAAQ